jgi:hypothetical protein
MRYCASTARLCSPSKESFGSVVHCNFLGVRGMAAAIFRLRRRSVFIQTLLSKEQREHKVTNSSWKLASID